MLVQNTGIHLENISLGNDAEPKSGFSPFETNFIGAASHSLRLTLKRIRRASSRLHAATGPHGIALLYHRIAEPAHDPWDLSVSPENFAEQMAVLRNFGECNKFSDFSPKLRNQPDARQIAVTFDDGYADNLTNALSVLRTTEIPATVFVATGSVGSDCEFWWDTLVRIFLETQNLPDNLSFTVRGQDRHWSVPNGKVRRELVKEIWALLLPAAPDEINHAVSDICAWAGVDRQGDPEAWPLNRDQLAELAASKWIEIGAHTRNHRPLSHIPSHECWDEITGSNFDLETWLSREITSFSYPYGKHNRDVVGQVREAGMTCACTVIEDIAKPRSDVLRIPRIQVRNWNGVEFERELRSFVGDRREI